MFETQHSKSLQINQESQQSKTDFGSIPFYYFAIKMFKCLDDSEAACHHISYPNPNFRLALAANELFSS